MNDQIFGIEPNDHAIYLDVKQYLANQHQGTHQVEGARRDRPHDQETEASEGYGRRPCRFDEIPALRGWWTRIRSSSARDYSFKLNKEAEALACLSAPLTYKAKGKSVTILENFN